MPFLSELRSMNTFRNSKRVIWTGRKVALGASPCPGWAVQLCEYYLISTSQQQICEKDYTGLIFFFQNKRWRPRKGKTIIDATGCKSSVLWLQTVLLGHPQHPLSPVLLSSSLSSVRASTESAWKLETLLWDFERTFLAQNFPWTAFIWSLVKQLQHPHFLVCEQKQSWTEMSMALGWGRLWLYSRKCESLSKSPGLGEVKVFHWCSDSPL